MGFFTKDCEGRFQFSPGVMQGLIREYVKVLTHTGELRGNCLDYARSRCVLTAMREIVPRMTEAEEEEFGSLILCWIDIKGEDTGCSMWTQIESLAKTIPKESRFFMDHSFDDYGIPPGA